MENNIQPNDFFTLLVIGILVMLAFALALVIFFYTSQRRLLQEKMRQQMLEIQYREELLYATIKTQEKERKRIAKDLHDEIGSKLNVILLNIGMLRRHTKTIPDAKSTMKDIRTMINTTIDTTRRISHDLLPPTLDDFGLAAAIQELVDAYDRTGTIHIDFQKEDNTERLSDKLAELNIFRVVQELIKNSILHGKSENITLQLATQPSHFSIFYQDDGVGFDMEALKERKGLGTQNIESRLNMSGATIRYESAIGEGVKAYINLK